MQQTDIMTADELFEMEEDEHRYELIQGKLVRMPPTGPEHSSIGVAVIGHLWNHIASDRLGRLFGADLGIVFSRDPDTVRVADVSFIRQERLAGQTDPSWFSVVLPDLAVEVISPFDRASDITAKARYYIGHDVPLVWVINPRNRTVIVYSPDGPPHTLNQDDELDGGDVLPDFQLAVSEIFG